MLPNPIQNTCIEKKNCLKKCFRLPLFIFKTHATAPVRGYNMFKTIGKHVVLRLKLDILEKIFYYEPIFGVSQ